LRQDVGRGFPERASIRGKIRATRRESRCSSSLRAERVNRTTYSRTPFQFPRSLQASANDSHAFARLASPR
jgi:hypothetical protein